MKNFYHRVSSTIVLFFLTFSCLARLIPQDFEVLPESFNADIIYVNHLASGMNDGSSWQDAFIDLQEALVLAKDGDQIWVSAGTYHPGSSGAPADSTWFSIKNGVEMYGGFSGMESSLDERNWKNHLTILSGDLAQDDMDGDFETNKTDNSLHVVVADSTINSSSILDGFIIEKGYTETEKSNSGLDNFYYIGGGMVSRGSPIIRNCHFRQNFAESGGGLCVWGNEAADIQISNCEFENNLADFWGGGLGAGPISMILVSNCKFINNSASDDSGGGVALRDGSAIFKQCNFESNNAPYGGAVIFYAGPFDLIDPLPHSIWMDSCRFSNNEAFQEGGALYNLNYGIIDTFNIKITNSHFTQNLSPTGGAIFNYNGALLPFVFEAEVCQFDDNVATRSGGAIICVNPMQKVEMWTKIIDCHFTRNTTDVNPNNFEFGNGGAIYFGGHIHGELKQSVFAENYANFGGALDVAVFAQDYEIDSSGVVKVSHCEFKENHAAVSGGAILYSWQGSGDIESCFFKKNTAQYAGGVGLSGLPANGVFPSVQINASTFIENSGTVEGGAVDFKEAKNNHITNSLFIGNQGPGSAIYQSGSFSNKCEIFSYNNTFVGNEEGIRQEDHHSKLFLQNSIFYENDANFPFSGGSISNGGNLCNNESLTDVFKGVNDINNTDPKFADPQNHDYHLQASSPCIDRGILTDVTYIFDIEGNDRIQGDGIDMGAYESPYTSSLRELKLLSKELIQISPNPVSEWLAFDLSGTWKGNIEMKCFDTQGRLVILNSLEKQNDVLKEVLNVTSLPSGKYTLLLQHQGEGIYGVFFKQ